MFYPVERDKTFIFPAAMFRTKQRPTHGGVDFTPVKQGENLPVFAVESGRITISSFSKQAGNNVMILTPGGRRWWYGHLERRDVKVGDQVRAGQRIGLMGTTGNSTGVHLHLELHFPYINAEANPWPLIANLPDINRKTIKPAASREAALAEYGVFMALSDGEQKELLRLARELWRIHIVPNTPFQYDAVILNEIRALRGEGALSVEDRKELAKEIAAGIGDEIAQDVADELNRRLAS